MYTSHTIMDFILICIFEFLFKLTLTAFKFFFCVFNTHISNLIQFVLINLSFDIFMFSLLNTYFLILLQENFIHFTFNNSIILLLPIKFSPICGIVPAVFSSPTFSILRTKVSQDLAFIWWITGAMDETYGSRLT